VHIIILGPYYYLLGIMQDEGADSKFLAGRRGRMWGTSPLRDGSGTGSPFPETMIFHQKWRVLMYSERYLWSVPSSEKCLVNFPLEMM